MRLHANDLHLLHRGHVEACQRARRQRPGIGIGISGIIDVDLVEVNGCRQEIDNLRPADNRQQTGDLINQLGGTTHIDRISGQHTGVKVADAGTTINSGMSGNRLDVDDIVARAAMDGGRPLMGGLYREGIRTRAETDVDLLEIGVGDATLDGLAANDGVGPHAQAEETAVSQGAEVIRYAVAVVDIQNIDLVRLIGKNIAVDRTDEIPQPTGERLPPARGELDGIEFDARMKCRVLIDQRGKSPSHARQRIS